MRLAIISDYKKLSQSADWSQLPDDIEIDVYHDILKDKQAIIERLKPYDIVVGGREETLFDREIIENLPNLKFAVSHGRRNRSYDLDAFRERGIPVSGTRSGFEMATVELTWALILSIAKNLPAEYAAVRQGEWGITLPMGLTGKTLGVLGLGRLGSAAARVGLAMEMNVITWSQNLTQSRCDEVGVTLASREQLFEQSDFLTIHTVLSDRTRGLIGAKEFETMKPTAHVINTSRGPIINEAAMIAALNNNVIAGVGLDVFDVEPLPKDHPLRSMANVLISPHLGGRTQENFIARYEDCVENVLGWLKQDLVRLMT
ncbi:MAG: D-2-hydroxyacid dehydrogenase family protein [Proteobacteria bacterium]|nr:D-2-hydroxyacid dehydrogenase family protein [Pseudomonadota bacterium]